VTNDDHASWWVGFNESSKESGWFPSNFVTRTAEAKPKSKPRRQVIITKRYEAADEDELTLEVGDVVKVKDDVDGWYLGRFNSVTGRFPSSHAEDYTPAESGARPLPQPPVQAPPTLPARSPALPQRVQADAGPTEALPPLSDDDADGARKEKKAGRRISRIFGAKKSRAKDGTPDAEPMSPADTAAHDE
ncbi:Protein BZZ1, partial [Coemansia helicoidea]